MVHSLCSRARPLRVVGTVFLVVFVLGIASPTYADPGNGHAFGRSGAAPRGQAVVHAKGGDKATVRSGTSPRTSRGHGWSKSSGDVTVPQPLSTADRNPGGANGQCPGGPYCSTRDGSPSLNGNGQGRAVGKPCAGCVGKADNKNPPGQMPNGSDHNAGYECDRNHGVGRTNPAHTGCKNVTPPPHKPPKPHKPPVPEKQAPPIPHQRPAPKIEQLPAAVVPQVQRPPAQVAPAAVAPAPGFLPPTGSDAFETGLALAGTVLLLAGGVVLLRRRTA